MIRWCARSGRAGYVVLRLRRRPPVVAGGGGGLSHRPVVGFDGDQRGTHSNLRYCFLRGESCLAFRGSDERVMGARSGRSCRRRHRMKLITATTIVLVSVFGAGAALAGEAQSLSEKLKSFAADGSYRVAQSCPYTGTVPCPAGPYGPGGCYKPSYAECKGGLICTGGMKVCVPSNGGPAYCYAPQNGNCR